MNLLGELSDALQVRSACGVFVHGGPGMGKTVLAHLLEESVEGFLSFLITATPTLRDIPYGALAPLLVDATPEDLMSPAAVLRVVLSFVRRRSSTRRVLIIVDDLHLLDGDSTLLLTQLVSYRAIMITGFAPSAAVLSRELASLADDGLVELCAMEPLTELDVLILCRQRLGENTALGVGRRLREESAGNPLFLPGILDEALRDGSLAVVDGVWVLKDTELSIPALLTQVVTSIVAQLDAPERSALEVLALSEVVSLPDLIRLSSEDAVLSLLRNGLVRILPSTWMKDLGSCTFPGRIMRTAIPTGRRCSLLREVGSKLFEDRTLPARRRIRHGIWALECAQAVPAEWELELAALALQNSDPRAALRLIGDIRSPESAVGAAVYRAVALFELSRLGESRQVSTGLLERAATPQLVTAMVSLEQRQAVAAPQGTGRPSHILERISRTLVNRTGTSREEVEKTPDLVIARASEANVLGRYAETIQALDPVFEEQPGDLRRLTMAHALLAEALGASGRTDEGLEHSSVALTLVDEYPELISDLHRAVVFRHLSLLVHSGGLAAAEEVLGNRAFGIETEYAFCSGSIAVLDAAIDARRGLFRSALAKIGPALVSLRRSDHDALLGYALGIGAWAAAVSGDAEQLVLWSGEFASSVSRTAAQSALRGEALITAASILHGSGSTTPALVDLARTARERRWYTAEKDILQLAVALGDDSSPALLATMAGNPRGAEPRVLRPLARRRRASIDGDPVTEQANPGAPYSLTSREREIAVLASDGRSNRAIARRLVVSSRTVEGHLYRVFAKLGIARREDLAAYTKDLPRGGSAGGCT